MKPEFIVDRELVDQLLVPVFGPSAQYLAHEPRDTDSYTIQIRTNLGKYRFVVDNETLSNTLNNKLTRQEADQIRQQLLLADSDPVVITSMKNILEQPAQGNSESKRPEKKSGCLGVLLVLIALSSLYIIL
jgi:hypothetical protein